MEMSKKKKKKERHIVTWTPEEDVILRDQITLHGTENWAMIASKFKDKSTRQCRRRWFTYLNSDFKRGGWSPEEDKLLCEAQRVFGNRWTEIAKVVSGRTDNAVKNRFTTLCKKKAKSEAMSEQNRTSNCLNSNNKRLLLINGEIEANAAKKMRRSQILVQSCPVSVFARCTDPKVTALMQQAELLSSLAQRVNAEKTEQSMENAWKILQDFLNKGKENELLRYGVPDMAEFKELVEDLRSSYEDNQPFLRQSELQESPASSEYSSGSAIMLDQTQQLRSDAPTEHKQGEEFSSPIKVTPLFRSLAADIPSPQFSESEKSFLLKTLGIESSSPCPSANPSHPPTCKRVLLHSL